MLIEFCGNSDDAFFNAVSNAGRNGVNTVERKDLMECFRIDESGYTGFDLLNPEQRFQGATAVAICNEDAERLIKEHFPKLQASELKYRSLVRRPGNHPRLLGLQRDILTNYTCVTYVCDKHYLLLLMFLGYAVEPFYYERGFDFYEDGQNYGMASLLYTAGPSSWEKQPSIACRPPSNAPSRRRRRRPLTN
jgi:hypothetical protein